MRGKRTMLIQSRPSKNPSKRPDRLLISHELLRCFQGSTNRNPRKAKRGIPSIIRQTLAPPPYRRYPAWLPQAGRRFSFPVLPRYRQRPYRRGAYPI